MFASPAMASPASIDMASGRNTPISTPSAARGTNRPLLVIEDRKSGPSPAPGVDIFTAIAITIGRAASTASPAWLRRRPPMSRSSERSRRVESRRCAAGRARPPVLTVPGVVRPVVASVVLVASAADIEALPRKRDEQVLQARPVEGEPAHPDPGTDQIGD